MVEVDDTVPVFADQEKFQGLLLLFQEFALRQLVWSKRRHWMDMVFLQCSRVVNVRHK